MKLEALIEMEISRLNLNSIIIDEKEISVNNSNNDYNDYNDNNYNNKNIYYQPIQAYDLPTFDRNILKWNSFIES